MASPKSPRQLLESGQSHLPWPWNLRLHCGYVFAAAQRYPRWKIADGNDLLRGLVKKKLLDDLRKKDLTITNQFINPQNLEQIFELPLKH